MTLIRKLLPPLASGFLFAMGLTVSGMTDPFSGGFARPVVNFDAGAETPAAGAFTAAGSAIAALLLTPLLYSLPIATLAATIIVAVLGLIDLRTPLTIWRYSRADFAAMAATIGVTLLLGVEPGVIAGVRLSLHYTCGAPRARTQRLGVGSRRRGTFAM
jgi:MFS superfamily sulfate permease-like transporter